MSESELEIFCTLMRMTSATQSRPKSTVFKNYQMSHFNYHTRIIFGRSGAKRPEGPMARFISTKNIDFKGKDMCG